MKDKPERFLYLPFFLSVDYSFISVLIMLESSSFHIVSLLLLLLSSISGFKSYRSAFVMTTLSGPPTVTTAIKLSPMVENMAVSKTIEIHALTKEMEKNGQTVFSLCVGEPDYDPPSEVIEATVRIR